MCNKLFSCILVEVFSANYNSRSETCMPARFSVVPNEANRPLTPNTVNASKQLTVWQSLANDDLQFSVILNELRFVEQIALISVFLLKEIKTHAMHFLTRDNTCTIHEPLASRRTPHACIDNNQRLFGLITFKTKLTSRSYSSFFRFSFFLPTILRLNLGRFQRAARWSMPECGNAYRSTSNATCNYSGGKMSRIHWLGQKL